MEALITFKESYGIPAATNGSPLGGRRLMNSLEIGWQRTQDHANVSRPAGFPLVYAHSYDDIQQQHVPGIMHIHRLLTNGIHANDTCAYLVTFIQPCPHIQS